MNAVVAQYVDQPNWTVALRSTLVSQSTRLWSQAVRNLRTFLLAAFPLFSASSFAQPSLCTKGEVTEWSCVASLSFTNEGYEYFVNEPLAGPTTIDVSKGQTPLGLITCDSATDTLTLTETQNRFKLRGIYQ